MNMSENEKKVDCPMYDDENGCNNGLGCWKYTNPEAKICAECQCLECDKAKCPPSIIYGKRNFYLNGEHYY